MSAIGHQIFEGTSAPVRPTLDACDRNCNAKCFDDEDPLTGALLVRSQQDWVDCHVATIENGVAPRPRSPASSDEETEATHAKPGHTRQRSAQTDPGLTAIEDITRCLQSQAYKTCAYRRDSCEPKLNPEDVNSESSGLRSKASQVVEAYFQHVREAFVIDERLIELDAEYKRSQQMDSLQHGLDQDVGLAQDSSEKLYRQRRQELAEALTIAHYRLTVRRNASLALGVDPEHYRFHCD